MISNVRKSIGRKGDRARAKRRMKGRSKEIEIKQNAKTKGLERNRERKENAKSIQRDVRFANLSHADKDSLPKVMAIPSGSVYHGCTLIKDI